jgi:uncharacterized protein (DUF697 family)/predicted GTPase
MTANPATGTIHPAMGTTFKEEFDRQVEAEYRKLTRPNVLIAGRTGVGKSRLVNAVLGEELARVGAGAPVTDCYTRYAEESVPVVLFDTRGWEGGAEKEAAFLADTEKFIAEHRAAEELISRIHIVWYAVDAPGARFTDFDENLIKKVFRDIPILLVLTKCDIASDEQIQDLRKEILARGLVEVIDIVEVAASPLVKRGERQSPPSGLQELVERTVHRLPELVRRAFISAQRIHIEMKRIEARKQILACVSGAFLVGFSPIPFSDATLLVPLQAAMVARVAVVYGFKRDEMVAITATSLAGSTVATVVGTTLANWLKFLPGLGSIVGGFINGTVAASLTAAMGLAFSALFSEIGKRTLAGDEAQLTPEWMLSFVREQFVLIWEKLKGRKQLGDLAGL